MLTGIGLGNRRKQVDGSGLARFIYGI